MTYAYSLFDYSCVIIDSLVVASVTRVMFVMMKMRVTMI